MNSTPVIIDSQPVSYVIGEGALSYSSRKLSKLPRLIILLDDNVREYCLPVFKNMLAEIEVSEVIEIKSGENFKNIEQSVFIWNELTRLNVDRDALLINLGGGIVTDIGGFAAATYKRGLPFINYPTTLLGMIDAAIGGKTGIDFSGFKNQVGLFTDPLSVIIDPIFLNTLDDMQWQSGYAEVLKYALIMDRELWRMLEGKNYHEVTDWNKVIIKAAKDKIDIVRYDAFEKGIRKNLNFGHTIGHAFESYFMKSGQSITHGKAIAAGMICETWISEKLYGEDCVILEEIEGLIDLNFERLAIPSDKIPLVLDLMRQDKKVREGKLQFSLIKKIGKALHNVEVEMEMVIDSIEYYLSNPSIP